MLTHQRGTRRAAQAGARTPPGGVFGAGGWGPGGSVGGGDGILGGTGGAVEATGAGSGGGLISAHGGGNDEGAGGGGIDNGDGHGGGPAAVELEAGGRARQRGAADEGEVEDEFKGGGQQTLDQRPR